MQGSGDLGRNVEGELAVRTHTDSPQPDCWQAKARRVGTDTETWGPATMAFEES